MAAYFDPTDPTHYALLPPQYQAGEALLRLAPVIEAEIIASYTVRARIRPPYYASDTVLVLDDAGYYVALQYYTPDADDCTSAEFVTAMRRTVARVLTWRLDQEKLSPFDASVSGQSGLGSSRSFRLDARDTLPPHWQVFLRRYDMRPTTVAI